MKKTLLAVSAIVASVFVLTACGNPSITYEGKTQKSNTVQEIIADKLEVENPGKDIEVTISVSND